MSTCWCNKDCTCNWSCDWTCNCLSDNYSQWSVTWIEIPLSVEDISKMNKVFWDMDLHSDEEDYWKWDLSEEEVDRLATKFWKKQLD